MHGKPFKLRFEKGSKLKCLYNSPFTIKAARRRNATVGMVKPGAGQSVIKWVHKVAKIASVMEQTRVDLERLRLR